MASSNNKDIMQDLNLQRSLHLFPVDPSAVEPAPSSNECVTVRKQSNRCQSPHVSWSDESWANDGKPKKQYKLETFPPFPNEDRRITIGPFSRVQKLAQNIKYGAFKSYKFVLKKPASHAKHFLRRSWWFVRTKCHRNKDVTTKTNPTERPHYSGSNEFELSTGYHIRDHYGWESELTTDFSRRAVYEFVEQQQSRQ